MKTQYKNPILPGFHPDPSICRVGEDYFLVNSSFEYFPGIPIYHSCDLVNWEQIGHVLDRDSQLTLGNGAPNCLGIYAPTLRYHDGIFYCIVTNVGGKNMGSPHGNFFVWTKDPYGAWSDPVWLPFEGIDPSLFFDEDGNVYYSGTDKGIYIAEIKLEWSDNKEELHCKEVGEKKYVWDGSGGNNPEGPHVYKVNGMYYLMIAEGGTEYCHMVTLARSKEIYGPYESCPHNPILSNRSTGLPIKATGHADIVEDTKGNWWAVCLGIRPLGYPFRHNLGRETMLIPAVWKDGWLYMGENGHVEEVIETDLLPESKDVVLQKGSYRPGSNVMDDFSGETLHPSWNTIYNYDKTLVELAGNTLILHGNHCGIDSDEPKALICRRQEHFSFTAKTVLTLCDIREKEEAGLSIYMNNRHHYEVAFTMIDGKKCLILRRRIGSLQAIEKILPYEQDTVTLMLRGSRESYQFFYLDKDHKEVLIGEGEASYLTTEVGGCFTGNYIAIYAAGTSEQKEAEAHVHWFSYQED